MGRHSRSEPGGDPAPPPEAPPAPPQRPLPDPGPPTSRIPRQNGFPPVPPARNGGPPSRPDLPATPAFRGFNGGAPNGNGSNTNTNGNGVAAYLDNALRNGRPTVLPPGTVIRPGRPDLRAVPTPRPDGIDDRTDTALTPPRPRPPAPFRAPEPPLVAAPIEEPPTEHNLPPVAVPADFDDFDDFGDGGDEQHDDEDHEEHDEPHLLLQWGAFIGQTVIGAGAGVGTWLGFYRLWSDFPFYAALGVGGVIVVMLVGAHFLRRRNGHELDLLSTILTVVVGVVLTVLPAAFSLQNLP